MKAQYVGNGNILHLQYRYNLSQVFQLNEGTKVHNPQRAIIYCRALSLLCCMYVAFVCVKI